VGDQAFIASTFATTGSLTIGIARLLSCMRRIAWKRDLNLIGR